MGLHQAATVLWWSTESKRWEDAKFMVFDMPEASGTFEDHMKTLSKLSLPCHVVPIKQVACTGMKFFFVY